jgi:hypothetical protein
VGFFVDFFAVLVVAAAEVAPDVEVDTVRGVDREVSASVPLDPGRSASVGPLTGPDGAGLRAAPFGTAPFGTAPFGTALLSAALFGVAALGAASREPARLAVAEVVDRGSAGVMIVANEASLR